MLFNSLHFLLFFPIVTLFYFTIPVKKKWMWLLAASYYFYMSWNPKYALLIALSTIITYTSGILISRANLIEDKKKRNFQRKLWVVLSLASNLSILFFFKYFNFAVYNINRLLSILNIDLVHSGFNVLLPIGISFYTFQALGYTIDVYRGDIQAERHLGKYALFVSFFPQLVAGPIERSKNLLTQMSEAHKFDYDRVKSGLLLMGWGLFQKMVIADRIAMPVNHIYNNWQEATGLQLLFATIFFAVQIYCDFCGYSNIATGAGEVLGFRLITNFKQPYFAVSIRDFWRRWHISLSTWFRDYLYIPLGGSQCSTLKKYRNIMITFLVSGLWHGANWSYIVWGGLHGVYQICEDIFATASKKQSQLVKKKSKETQYGFLKRIVTFALVCFAWVFFRAPDLSSSLKIIGKIFSPSLFFDGSLSYGIDKLELIIALISIALLLFVDYLKNRNSESKEKDSKKRTKKSLGKLTTGLRKQFAGFPLWIRWSVYLALIYTLLIFGIYGPAFVPSEFIYFQF